VHWDFILIFLFLGIAVPLLGHRRIRQLMALRETTTAVRIRLYASTAASQWLVTAIVLWRTRARGILLSQLGAAIPSAGLCSIVTVLLSVLIFLNQLLSLRRISRHPSELRGLLPQLALKIFPQKGSERLPFTVLIFSVAVCEEAIYRGFVQHVLGVVSGLTALAVLGSAALFALAHAYQGRRGLISTFVVGVIFGSVCAWTGSLLPSVVAHFVADLSAGFMAPSRIKAASATQETIAPARA
jgi:uncharacterized protein